MTTCHHFSFQPHFIFTTLIFDHFSFWLLFILTTFHFDNLSPLSILTTFNLDYFSFWPPFILVTMYFDHLSPFLIWITFHFIRCSFWILLILSTIHFDHFITFHFAHFSFWPYCFTMFVLDSYNVHFWRKFISLTCQLFGRLTYSFTHANLEGPSPLKYYVHVRCSSHHECLHGNICSQMSTFRNLFKKTTSTKC